MLTRTEGVVLKTTTFGDADLIVTYLSRDCGMLKAFAKSPRKLKSRFGSSLEPLTYSRIAVLGREDAQLPRLTQSDILRPFQTLRENYSILIKMIGLVELNLRFLPEREPNIDAFRLLVQMLNKVEQGGAKSVYQLYYKYRFLQIAGYLPGLEICGRCGAVSEDAGIHHFYLAHGSILCEHCAHRNDEKRPISSGAIRFFQSMQKWRFSTIDRIKVPESLLAELESLLDVHIAFILAKPLRSSAFIA
jgi:DNA repair protein RecO (recombination protein O)